MTTTKWAVPLALLFALPGCGRKPVRTVTPPPGASAMPGSVAMAALAQPKVGSAGYYLELASLHERYLDPEGAAGHFTRTIELADGSPQALQGYLGLARVKEAVRDLAGAIAALEQARGVTAKLRARADGGAMAPPGMMAYGPQGGELELTQRLARLYAETGELDQAERLYEQALRVVPEPYVRDQLIRSLVELYRRAGTLDQRIAQREALAAKTPDEVSLRVLAVAYGGDGGAMGALSPAMPPPPRPGAAGAPRPAPDVSKAVAVYRRLHELRPDDPQVRQALLALYEKAGRVDDAVVLLRTRDAAPRAGGAGPGPETPYARCPGGLTPRPTPVAVTRSEEVIRLLLRAGRREPALAETAKLVALAPQEGVGVPACVAAARLYAAQGRPELVAQAQAAGRKVARSAEDRRELAVAEAELAAPRSPPRELKALYERWQQSDDPCLRAEATRRGQVLAAMSGPPMNTGAREGARRVP
ncbi:MAG TPA: tetratricopeptide repeat protein [Polyangia bacterium]|jgi:tetratricopeptide (TPR) repeat protein